MSEEVDVSEDMVSNGLAEGGNGGGDEKRGVWAAQPKKTLQPPSDLRSLTLPTAVRLNQGATEHRYL